MEMRRMRLPGGPIVVEAEVLAGLEFVRASGRTNMLDRGVVADLAATAGFGSAARWVRQHPDRFAEGVFRGFRALRNRDA